MRQDEKDELRFYALLDSGASDAAIAEAVSRLPDGFKSPRGIGETQMRKAMLTLKALVWIEEIEEVARGEDN